MLRDALRRHLLRLASERDAETWRRSPLTVDEQTLANPEDDGVPSVCVVNFDNLHTLPKDAFRRRITGLSPLRMHHACRVLQAATGC